MDPSASDTRITCPRDGGVAVLLVDVETESIPYIDEESNPVYFCLEGHHVVTLQGKTFPGGGKLRLAASLPLAV